MKKKVLVLAAMAAMTITGALVVNTSVKEAKASSDCVNGCVVGSYGCICNGYYPDLAEHLTPIPTIGPKPVPVPGLPTN